PDEEFDNDIVGDYTGAGVIFGVTGGVMEAALRTVVWKLTGEKNDSPVVFNEVRGVEGIKEATYKVGDLDVKIAVASGLANARKLLDMVKSGEKQYHFIEIMACPGGCVNGGGQPQVCATTRNFEDIRALRAKALYSSDEANKIRFSHENESIKKVYAEFFGEPGSHKAHEILHTSYVPRVINQ
ncbi:MAG: iron hydrogenase small subunit, partial [Lachnospiraceae bacterium]|nr:iron hydrogenase small subunit [Lachnospiraceae bacterium]